MHDRVSPTHARVCTSAWVARNVFSKGGQEDNGLVGCLRTSVPAFSASLLLDSTVRPLAGIPLTVLYNRRHHRTILNPAIPMNLKNRTDQPSDTERFSALDFRRVQMQQYSRILWTLNGNTPAARSWIFILPFIYHGERFFLRSLITSGTILFLLKGSKFIPFIYINVTDWTRQRRALVVENPIAKTTVLVQRRTSICHGDLTFQHRTGE